jgi:hypothetical protein
MSSLAVVSTKVCSAALSIGLSADSCCLWHDESPTTATPVITATATTLSLVFILDGLFAILITSRDSQPEIRKTKEIHDLLRLSDWVRAYRVTAEFFDRKSGASGERQ